MQDDERTTIEDELDAVLIGGREPGTVRVQPPGDAGSCRVVDRGR